MASNKLSSRRATRGAPHVCHPPPPPPLPPPPLPPACPPATIGGYVEANWGPDYDPIHYYSPYSASPDEEDPLVYHHTNFPPAPGQELIIRLQEGGPHLDIELTIWDEGETSRYYSRADFPFTWCVANHITCSEWDEYPDEHIDCAVNMQW